MMTFAGAKSVDHFRSVSEEDTVEKCDSRSDLPGQVKRVRRPEILPF